MVRLDSGHDDRTLEPSLTGHLSVQQDRPFLPGNIHVRPNFEEGAFVDHRSHVMGRILRWTDTHTLRRFRQPGDKLIIHRFQHDDP